MFSISSEVVVSSLLSVYICKSLMLRCSIILFWQQTNVKQKRELEDLKQTSDNQRHAFDRDRERLQKRAETAEVVV